MNEVALSFKRPDKEIIERFRKIATPSICECLGGSSNIRTYMSTAIKPIVKGTKICGPASTCLCHIGDNLMLHKALQLAQSGDVLVVAHGGFTESAPWGEMMSLAAKKKGLEGIVIDGAARDTPKILEIGFSVFARGSAMAGTLKNAPGLLNRPIQCGNAYIKPGDIVIGDDDGVVIVPKEIATEVLEKAELREDNEEKTAQKIKNGEITDFMATFQPEYDKLIKSGKIKEIPFTE